jgi:uncharacterized protein (DUF2164 family)
MKKVKRQWDLISDDRRKYVIEEVMRFFHTSRDEEIGMIAAEEVLDAVLELIAVDIYKKGISEAKQIVEERMEDLKVDLDMIVN